MCKRMTMERREARRADSTAQRRKRPWPRHKVQVERCHPDPNTVRLNATKKYYAWAEIVRRRRRGERERTVYERGAVENECVVCIILWIMYFWGDITLSSHFFFLPPLAPYFQSTIFLSILFNALRLLLFGFRLGLGWWCWVLPLYFARNTFNKIFLLVSSTVGEFHPLTSYCLVWPFCANKMWKRIMMEQGSEMWNCSFFSRSLSHPEFWLVESRWHLIRYVCVFMFIHSGRWCITIVWARGLRIDQTMGEGSHVAAPSTHQFFLLRFSR